MGGVNKKKVTHGDNNPDTFSQSQAPVLKSVTTDILTGFYNYQHFDKYVKDTVKISKRTGEHFSLLMIDINNFKMVNDKYGSSAGNRVLIDLAKILKKSVRRVDICFRYGSDEFAIILPNATRNITASIVKRLQTTAETHEFFIDDKTVVYLELSIGVAIFPSDGIHPVTLIEKANEELHMIKRQKRKRSEPFILRTKLTPPVLKENVIVRTRLVSLLKKNLDKKLISVIADAGYGKTTLLTQFIQNHNGAVVFYNLDRTDSDLMVFFSYLMHGMEKLQSHVVERSNGLLKQGIDVVKNYELVMGTLINELVEKRTEQVLLIFDDYHTITNDSMVHKAVNYFIDHLPDTVHVLIASRIIPALNSLATWRAKQSFFEVSRDDLIFTHDEIKALLTGVYRVIPSDDELRRVSEHTEGWVTGIQLIIQSAGRDRKTVKETLNGYMAQNQPLFEYFANEILTGESPQIQDFLKCSAVLEVMTPDDCNVVLGMKDSVRLLRDLEHRNLFVSTIGKDEYKYHFLFRQFLLGRIDNERLQKSLNLKAARYYKKKGQIEQAIQHYLTVKNYTWASKLIAHVSKQIETQMRFTTLDTWLNQIPESVLEEQPRLLITQGDLYRMHGNLKKAEDLYTKAEHLLRNTGNMSDLAYALMEHGTLMWTRGSHERALKYHHRALNVCPHSEDKLRVNLFNSIGLVLRATGDFKKARTYLLKAYRLAEYTEDFTNVIITGNNLAYLPFSQGDMREAFKLFVPLIERIKNDYRLQFGIIFANAAKTAIALGKLAWAEQCLDQGWALCRPYEDPWSKAALQQAFGALYLQKTQWNIAEQYFCKAFSGFKKLQWTEQEIALLRDFSRLYRCQGDYAQAKENLEQLRQKVSNIESPSGIFVMREIGLLHVAVGEFKKAEEPILASLRLAQKFGRKVSECLSYFACATYYLATNKQLEAAKYLRRAVHLVKTKGYSGILLRELRLNPNLIEIAQQHNIEKNYLLSFNVPKDKPQLEIKVQCFGGLQLYDTKDEPLPVIWPTEKTRSLFAFLIAQHEAPAHREVILEHLWPGLPKKRASINFRTTATRMRQSLTKALSGKIAQNEIFIRRHGKYQLLPEVALHADTDKYEFLLKEAERVGSDQEKAHVIRCALDLYRGDYVPEIYDSWTDVVRRRFREHRLRALHWFAQYSLKQGDDRSCVDACETYLSIDPVSEEITRLYMKGLYRLGRVAAIKTCYNILRQVLQKELHSSPDQETEELYHSLVDSSHS
jgi:LuxR family maltose regulon positive regulatory protein